LNETVCPIGSALANAQTIAAAGFPLRMKLRRQFAVLAVAVGLLPFTACKKKTQPVAINRQAPTLAVQVPDEIPEEPLPAEPQPPVQEATTEAPPVKKPPAKHRSKKPAPPPATNQNNPTVATNRPPANPAEASTDAAIAADLPSQQVIQQQQTTNQLLDSTEKDLKSLNRGLSHDEEIIRTQIRSYIGESRKATKDGDFERAYNLAVKAHLLVDALIKK
jgi:outer membrane biosynthesis protein TonB